MYDENGPEPTFELNTDNATKFYWRDPKANYPRERRFDDSREFANHYHRLYKHNLDVVGKWNDQPKVRKRDNLAIFDAVANYLDVPEYHHKVAKTQFESCPLSKWSSPDGIDVTLVSIMCLAVILQRDPRMGRAYNPDRGTNNNDSLFVTLLDNLGYRQKDMRSCYQKTLAHIKWKMVDWTEGQYN